MAVLQDGTGNNISSTNPLPISNVQSSVIQPIDIQSRLASTIQTHNAVSVGMNGGTSPSSWIDCDGFTDLAITFKNDAGADSQAHIDWSNDGTTQHGQDTGVVPRNTNAAKTGQISVRSRYAKLTVVNHDTVAHTISAYVYLKA